YFFSREKSTKRARVFLVRNLGKENAEKPDAFFRKNKNIQRKYRAGMFFVGFKSKFLHNFRLFCTASLRTRRKKSAWFHI
ncbi:MAG: hypothetical protein J5844_04635, partial [Clostridia bacterium]|nr:hypothetical protein [Clostridia bacterium]